MADAYPWGAQAPQARLTKLQQALARSQSNRETYLEQHKQRIAQFDEADKQTKSDIRACENILEKERTEAQSQALAKVLARSAGVVDLDALLRVPGLEKKLAELAAAAPTETKTPKKASKPDKASVTPPAATEDPAAIAAE